MKTVLPLFAAGLLMSGCVEIRSFEMTSFEECAAAGYPVMEAPPRECHADGRIFVEEPGQANPSK